jgi:HTH-type transcriptional regulator/antitoxin HipB
LFPIWETFTFVPYPTMKPIFNLEMLPHAVTFLNNLDDDIRYKVYYNLKKAQYIIDQELFKKLNNTIWEFRTQCKGKQIRIFAFWDNHKPHTLVLATHGIIKKSQKTPPSEIIRAEKIRKDYFETKKIYKYMKTVSLDTLIDKHIGKRGEPKREAFEQELRIDLLGHAIKTARKKRNMTQAQLGELVGVQKAQISKIENSIKNARFDTILKLFDALAVRVHFRIEYSH